MKNLQLFDAIGLMSGTSMDGIDAAYIETDGLYHVRLLGHFSVAYDSGFYQEMKAVEGLIRSNQSFEWLTQVHRKVDALNARAVVGLCKKYSLDPKTMDIVGYHGQTVYHKPSEGITIQLGNPRELAHDVGIPVMGYVRQQDVQQGGQGAPIAPIYHQALVVRDHLVPAVIVNCGGISNISAVMGNETTELLGFDVGPGNGLLDRWVQEKTQGRENMDKNGQYALAGKVQSEMLKALYTTSCIKDGKNYYEQKPPKSLDIRDFHWPPTFSELSLEDGCATLATFTAQCIVDALKFLPKKVRHIIITGGGAYHPLILQTLKERTLTHYSDSVRVMRGDEAGWNPQSIEAELMAFLAVRCLKRWPITFPNTTGVPHPTLGGEIFYP